MKKENMKKVMEMYNFRANQRLSAILFDRATDILVLAEQLNPHFIDQETQKKLEKTVKALNRAVKKVEKLLKG